MIYGRYKNARDAAWKCLLDFNISELPINILNIVRQAGIRAIENSSVLELNANQAGETILYKNRWYIIFDDKMSVERCRFTIAHELGHIFLGHALNDGKYARTIDRNKPAVESEADVFASRLLAPACVLWGLNVYSGAEIARLCKISPQAATVRAAQMEILLKRQKFLTHPLERRVFENFKRFIDENKR